MSRPYRVEPSRDASFTRLAFFLLSMTNVMGAVGTSIAGIISNFFNPIALAAVMLISYLVIVYTVARSCPENRQYKKSSKLLLFAIVILWALLLISALLRGGGVSTYGQELIIFLAINVMTIKFMESAMIEFPRHSAEAAQ